jgi:hypothetical protein
LRVVTRSEIVRSSSSSRCLEPWPVVAPPTGEEGPVLPGLARTRVVKRADLTGPVLTRWEGWDLLWARLSEDEQLEMTLDEAVAKVTDFVRAIDAATQP